MQSRGVAFHVRFSSAKVKFRFEILGSDFLPAYFVGALQGLMHTNRLKAQLQLPFGNSSHIEQVVNQPRFQFDVAPNDIERFSDRLGIWQLGFQLAHHCNYRRERASQLM